MFKIISTYNGSKEDVLTGFSTFSDANKYADKLNTTRGKVFYLPALCNGRKRQAND